MAFGYNEGEALVVHTFFKELGYGHGRRGYRWALRAFGALADRQENLRRPLTRRYFPVSVHLELERILTERERPFHLLDSKEACDQVMQRVYDENWEEDILEETPD